MMNDLLILVRELTEAQVEHLRAKRVVMSVVGPPPDDWIEFMRSIGGFDGVE